MIRRYIDKMISFACDLQKVPHVEVVYDKPEGANEKIVKYIPGKKGTLNIDTDNFKKQGKKALFALFTELRRYYQDYTNMEYDLDLEYAIDANAFAVLIMKVYFGINAPISNDLPMTRVMATNQLSQTLGVR